MISSTAGRERARVVCAVRRPRDNTSQCDFANINPIADGHTTHNMLLTYHRTPCASAWVAKPCVRARLRRVPTGAYGAPTSAALPAAA